MISELEKARLITHKNWENLCDCSDKINIALNEPDYLDKQDLKNMQNVIKLSIKLVHLLYRKIALEESDAIYLIEENNKN